MASMNGTDLDDHSFCCFKAASTASLATLIEAEVSVLDNGPSGSGKPPQGRAPQTKKDRYTKNNN